MISNKRNDFQQNDWLPLVFSLQFSFVVNKLSLEIDNDELDFSYYAKILIKDTN